MAGHSKWKQIKRKKAVTDARRASSGPRSSAKSPWRREPAAATRRQPAAAHRDGWRRAVNMPKENIERAIKKGTGELEGAQYQEVTYEGYGPGGVPS